MLKIVYQKGTAQNTLKATVTDIEGNEIDVSNVVSEFIWKQYGAVSGGTCEAASEKTDTLDYSTHDIENKGKFFTVVAVAKDPTAYTDSDEQDPRYEITTANTPIKLKVTIDKGTAQNTLKATVTDIEGNEIDVSNVVSKFIWKQYGAATGGTGEAASEKTDTLDYSTLDLENKGKFFTVVAVAKDPTAYTDSDEQNTRYEVTIITPPSSNNCDYNVLNCKYCKEDDSSYCEECEPDYGLKGGYCYKCGKGLFIDSRSPCKLDCSAISNCADFGYSYGYWQHNCDIENGQFYCYRCDGDFEPSDDYKTCVAKSFSCSDIDDHCTKCNTTTKECLECDTKNHWVLDEDGECSCDNENNYYLYKDFYNDNYQCLYKETCDENSNCELCLGPNKFCQSCNDGYGLLNGKCKKCTLDVSKMYNPMNNQAPCFVECSVENCDYCLDGNTNECYHCKEDFDEVDGKCLEKCKDGLNRIDGKCVNTTEVDCPNLWGCDKCRKNNMNYCIKCKDTFRRSMAHDGTCICDIDYDFVDNKCVRPIGPYVPPSINKTELTELPDNLFVTTETNEGTNYTLDKNDGIGDKKEVIRKFNKNDGAVTIPDKFRDYEYYFDIENREKPFTVQIPTETVANIECKGDKTHLNLPADNKKINIYGGGQLTLNPIGNENSLTLNNVNLDQFSKNIELDSDKANLTLLVLDVSGPNKECKGQEKGNNNHQTICQLVKVEPDSSFTPLNLKLEKIMVAYRSLIKIDNSVDIENAEIELYHSVNSYGNQNVPLSFTGSDLPKIVRSIVIRKSEEGKPLPEEQENFTVADFDLGTNSKKACEDAQSKFQGGDGFPSKAECVPDKDNANHYTLITTKENNQKPDDDKGGLSGGAIAGIVIACVVVVAAIIALLVYFLVIKKKNQSTTSTQGDSSIAI